MTGTPELAPERPAVPESEQKAENQPTPEPAEQAVPTVVQPIQQPVDDTSQQITPASTQSVQAPASQQQLHDWSKGDPGNALTWLAAYWLRLIKKALHFGWQIVGKQEGE